MGFGSDISGAMDFSSSNMYIYILIYTYHSDVENVAQVEVDIFSMFYPPQDEHLPGDRAPKRNSSSNPSVFFGAILVSGFQCAIIYGSDFCICSCFFHPIHQKSQRRWKRRRKTSNFHRCPKAEIGEIGEFLVRLIDRNWCKIQKDREILQVSEISQFQGFSCVVLLP